MHLRQHPFAPLDWDEHYPLRVTMLYSDHYIEPSNMPMILGQALRREDGKKMVLFRKVWKRKYK